ncbi:hypothetical protein AMECASPLE_022830 [Ameca splendens]|uniref:Serpin domain-containing protein n=1 Tax=Ameca splendens TaxID=208324 RepID=A0ABV0ZDH3_9TELE
MNSLCCRPFTSKSERNSNRNVGEGNLLQETRGKMAVATPLATANTSFSLALLRKLGDNDNTANVFFSPFSISSALAMVMLGARGNTSAQMSETLKTLNIQDDVHSSFALLLRELNKPGAPYALSVANRLYGEQSYQFFQVCMEVSSQH